VRAKRVWCITLRLPIKSRLNLTRKHPRRRGLIGKPQRRIFSTAETRLSSGAMNDELDSFGADRAFIT
jgi:hypothetical protein